MFWLAAHNDNYTQRTCVVHNVPLYSWIILKHVKKDVFLEEHPFFGRYYVLVVFKYRNKRFKMRIVHSRHEHDNRNSEHIRKTDAVLAPTHKWYFSITYLFVLDKRGTGNAYTSVGMLSCCGVVSRKNNETFFNYRLTQRLHSSSVTTKSRQKLWNVSVVFVNN